MQDILAGTPPVEPHPEVAPSNIAAAKNKTDIKLSAFVAIPLDNRRAICSLLTTRLATSPAWR